MNRIFRQISFFLSILVLLSFSSLKLIQAISNVEYIVEGAIIIKGQIVELNDSSFTLKVLEVIQGDVKENRIILKLTRRDILNLNSSYLFYLQYDYLTLRPKRFQYHRAYHPIANDSIWMKNERTWYSVFPKEYTYETNRFMAKPVPFELSEFINAIKDIKKQGKRISKKLNKEIDIITERSEPNIKYNRPKKLELTNKYLIKFSSKSKSHKYLMHEFINDYAQGAYFHFERKHFLKN